MIDLEDLGLTPNRYVASIHPAPSRVITPLALTPESPLARTLYEVWSGRPVTVVKAAPGSGKSTLITRLVSLLLVRTDLSVAILTPTRGGGVRPGRAGREALAENCGPREKFTCIFGVEPADRVRPGALGRIGDAGRERPAA